MRDEGMMDRCSDLCWYRHVHNFVFEPRVAWKSVTGGHLLEPCGSLTSGGESLFFDFNHH